MRPEDNNENPKYNIGLTIQSDIARGFIAGSLAGITVAYSTFPLEALKKVRQVGGMLKETKVPLYRGSLVFAGNIVPTTTIQMGVNNILAHFVHQEDPLLKKIIGNIVCGSAGALTGTFVENAIVRQQIMQCGPLNAIKNMFEQSYLRPWKSYPLIATRDSIFINWMFLVTPSVQKYIAEKDKRFIFPATLLAGFVGAAVSHPFDTIATNMQATHERHGYLKTFTTLMAAGGATTLFRGLPFRIGLFTFFSTFIPAVAKDADDGLKNGYLQGPYFFSRIKKQMMGREEEYIDNLVVEGPKNK